MRLKDNLIQLYKSSMMRRSLLIPSVFVGIILPIDFLTQVDGFIKFLRVSELLPVFALAWIAYCLIGMLLSSVVGAITLVLCFFSGGRKGEVYHKIGLAGSISFIVLTVVRGIKLWCNNNGFVSAAIGLYEYKWSITSGVILAVTVYVFLNPTIPRRFIGSVLRLSLVSASVAFFGLCLIVYSLCGSRTDYPHQSTAIVSRPNIILITADAFSARHASAYGYARPTTLELEKVAQSAFIFDRYYANSNFTTCSINSLINGTRPWTHRVFQISASQNFSRQTVSVVQALKTAGYRTISVTTNVNASPIQAGCEKWFDSLSFGGVENSTDIVLTALSHIYPLGRTLGPLPCFSNSIALMDRILVFSGCWRTGDWHQSPKAFDTAQRFLIGGERSQPVFLWVHLFAPHAPYASRPPFLGAFDGGKRARTRFDSSPGTVFLSTKDKKKDDGATEARYDECVACLDHDVGGFIDWLKAQKLWENSLFVFSADHGESFGHDYGAHGGPMLYEDLIRVPLIIKTPRQIEGQRIDVLTEEIDVMPTILDFAGIPKPDSCEGRSLKRETEGGALNEKPVFSMNFEQNSCFGSLKTGSVAMIEGSWKYVRFIGKPHYPNMPNIEDALYDLTSDPRELVNRISDSREIAIRMCKVIETQLRTHDRPKESDNLPDKTSFGPEEASPNK